MVRWPELEALRETVRNSLNDQAAGLYEDDTLLNVFLNVSQRDIAVKSLCLETSLPAVSVADTRTLAINPDVTIHKMHAVEYVKDAGVPISLFKITVNQIGHTGYGFRAPVAWFPWAPNTVYLDPIPGEVLNFNVYCSVAPSVDMVLDKDVPQIPAEYHDLIVDHTLFLIHLRERHYGRALALYSAYTNAVRAIREKVVTKYTTTPKDMQSPTRVTGVPPRR